MTIDSVELIMLILTVAAIVAPLAFVAMLWRNYRKKQERIEWR